MGEGKVRTVVVLWYCAMHAMCLVPVSIQSTIIVLIMIAYSQLS